MLLYLLKKQFKTAVVFTFLLCIILIMQTSASWKNSLNGQYYDEQVDYLSQYDLTDRSNFFDSLTKDTSEAYQKVREIEEFMAYEGEIPEGVVNPLEIASSGAMYMDYDMVVWRQNMLNLPGLFTESVSGDKYMLEALSKRLEYMLHLPVIIENHKEITTRGIRRGGSDGYKYELAIEELNAISLDFPVEDVAYTQNLLDFMHEDWYFTVLIAVVFFWVFSAISQQRISWVVSTSLIGARKYAFIQATAALLTSIAIFVIYHIGIILACSLWNPTKIIWNHPVQCVFGNVFDSYEIILNLKVWEYTLIALGLKCLFCLFLSSIILLLSLLSGNNTVSAIYALIICGVLILAHNEMPFGGLLIGNTSCLLEGLCWTKIGATVISYSTIYIFVATAAIILCSGLTIFLSKPILRRCSK